MSFFIADGVRADILLGDPLEARPEFFLDGLVVTVGPYSDQILRERHVLRTVGSVDWFSFDSVDDMRFDPASGLLLGVALHMAERDIPGDSAIPIPAAETGVIRLAEPQDFRLVPASVRWKVPRHSALICLYGDAASEISLKRTVRIAESVDLIIDKDRLSGWILHSPHRYLSAAGVAPGPVVDDRELEQALDLYLSIAIHPAVDRLLDGDQTVWDKLDRIADLISSGEGDSLRRSILKRQIDYLMEWR